MNPVEIDYRELTGEQLSDLYHSAFREMDRRRYEVEPVRAGTRAINDSNATSDRELVVAAFNGARKAGWRIVRTDPATGDCPIVITDEWQPDTTPVPDVDPHVVTPIEEG